MTRQMRPPFRPIPALGPPRATPRARALAQWRGFDASRNNKASMARVRPLTNILPNVLSTLRIDRRQAEAEVVKVWNNLLDPAIVAHAQPAGLRKGTLFVNVDSSVWLSEIVVYRRKEILDRLHHSFGKELIKKISFRLG